MKISIFVACAITCLHPASGLNSILHHGLGASHLDRSSFRSETNASSRFLMQAKPEQANVAEKLEKGLEPVKKELQRGVSKPRDIVKNQLNRTMDAPQTSYNMARDDTRVVFSTFMPGYVLNKKRATSVWVTVLLASVWFFLYFNYFYTSDRADDLTHWKKQLDKRRDHSSYDALQEDARSQVNADFVMVFHHPKCHYGDAEKLVTKEALERCFVSHKLTRLPKHLARELGAGKDSTTPRTKSALAKYGETTFSSGESENDSDSELDMIARATIDPSTASFPVSSLGQNSRIVRGATKALLEQPLTFESARFAFLKDMYCHLQEWGFNVKLFTSIDDDEIFMCVSLSRDDALEHYLIKNNIHLQLQPDIVKELGIDQPPWEYASSPPSLPYNPHDVESLHKAHLLKSGEASEVYKVEYNKHLCKSNISKSADRIQCIKKEVYTVFDLDALREQKLLVDWFPAHDHRQGLNKLYAVWAHWTLLADLTMVQPISHIKNYFGTRIAFNFAWNGTYCKCLLALLPVAAVIAFAVYAMKAMGFETKELAGRRILSFGIILAVWSRIAHNTWSREFAFFSVLFEADEQEKNTDICPTFHGTSQPSPVDLSKQELQYPGWKHQLRRIISLLVTFTYSGFVASMVAAFMHMAVKSNNGALGFYSNMYLVFQLKVFQFLYNMLAKFLTNWENHKYYEHYYNSHVWKQVFFQFVNYYVPFFYLVGRQKVSEEGCPAEGCLFMLQQSLNSTLVLLGLFRLTEICFYHMLTNWKLHAELVAAGHGLEGNSNRPAAMGAAMSMAEAGLDTGRDQQHCFLEKQAKYSKFRILEQIETMLELVLALGYVFIFGAVAFGTVLFCFLVFFIQLRASAYLLTSNAQRPQPRRSIGIGAWSMVVDMIMKIGVLFEGFLIVTFDQSFEGTAPITKLMGIVVFWMICASMWFLVDLIVPSPDEETILLEKRRRYTRGKFLRKTGHLTSHNRQNCNWEVATELTMDYCERIPHFDGSTVCRTEENSFRP